jgi:hypothetical protein
MTQDQNDNSTEKKTTEEKVSNTDFLMKADQQTKNVKSTHINLSQDSSNNIEELIRKSQSTSNQKLKTDTGDSND